MRNAAVVEDMAPVEHEVRRLVHEVGPVSRRTGRGDHWSRGVGKSDACRTVAKVRCPMTIWPAT